MLTLQSKLITQLKLVLCVITLFSIILPFTTSIIHATSPPQNAEQAHQVFLPLVSNGGSDSDIGGDGLIQAASVTADLGLYTTDKIIVIGSNRAINICLNSADSIVSGRLLPDPTVISLQGRQRIKIYSISPTSDPLLPIDQRLVIRQEIAEFNSCRGVTAEPNYIYKFGSDPWIAGGGSIAMKDAGEGVGPNDFRNQHIFTNILDVDMDIAMTIRLSNQPIIGFFDTKPTKILAEFNIQRNRDFMSIDDGDMSCENPELIKEHGINVVSLADAVSFHNDIYLYRVLNNCGQGDLATLLSSLENFMTTTASEAEQGRPRIVNMSLSARHVPLEYDYKLNGTPSSLDALLEKMKNAGIVLVASAGNTSTRLAVEEIHWPASSPHVLAVAASNGSSGRACYSNPGDIAAPGGYTNTDYLGSCQPRMNLCSLDTTSQCILAKTSTGGLNYVKGTSFASPLVAGVIARNLATQPRGNVDNIYNCIKGSADEVLDADMGAGVVTMNFNKCLGRTLQTPVFSERGISVSTGSINVGD